MATDFHRTEKSVQIANILPWVWKETAVADGLGEYYPLSLWSQPIHTIFGFLALVNIPFEIQAKIFGLVILTLGFWGVWRLLDKFNINKAGKSAGSIFFLLNSYFILLFDGGQLSLALAYAVLPTVVFYFFKITETGSAADKLQFAIWTLVLSVADIRILYLVFGLIVLFSIFKIITNKENVASLLKRLFSGTIITVLVLIGFHMYWLLPTLVSQQIQLPQTYERASQVDFLSFSSLPHSLLLLQPHWYQNVFGKLTTPRPEFVLIPFLVFSTLLLYKKNIIVAFWLLISLVSVFLSKGSNEPLGQVYSFLFTYLPGFSLFRDPSKFYFLIALSYSILIAFSVSALSKIKFLPVLLILYFIFLARPLYLGQMNGLFSQPLFQKEFETISEKIKNDDNFSRVFWIPTTASLGYTNLMHPAVPADRLSQKRPFAIGAKGTYESFNFLREASYAGEIFDVSGIGSIVYPYLDPRRDDMHPDNIKYYYTFSGQLAKLPWLSSADSFLPLYRVQQHQDRFFIADNIWWVIGSDSIYSDATKSAQLKLANNALIFAEEKAGAGQRIDEIPEAKIVLNQKSSLDLAAGFLNPEDLIFPAKNLDFEPNGTGWWKREAADLVRWRSFLQGKYGIDNQDFDLGGGWAAGEKSVELKVKSEKFNKNKILLVRVMESSRSGTLKFYQGEREIGEVATKIEGEANVRWFEVGQLSDSNELIIKSAGGINVVNALAVLDESEWIGYKRIAKEYQNQDRIVNFDEKNTESGGGSVIYQRVNPTKYKINVSGLTKPALLVFSQNYNSLWKINGRAPLPVYSLLNGFRVEEDGEYMVEYEPQKYVYPGLIISGITIAVSGLLLFKLRKAEV